MRDGSRMSDLSTQEVYLTAPESAATRRRRLRTERTLHESPPEENAIDSDNPLKEHTGTYVHDYMYTPTCMCTRIVVHKDVYCRNCPIILI